ncbi:hypothetical protein J25TS5_10380 [Paenibacillus faecis]|uniref:helix-turn-helix transcriptional regulator n=1 Tax=Paenibacillus faecis TaxID=862114 RepID=UPI001B11A9EA|nr:helix-turn-helix domain-containing protein [Paenibacillus faecis]GIO84106.1 hypothetical protein J25TS5_10380 [Paenibacillus faecis]
MFKVLYIHLSRYAESDIDRLLDWSMPGVPDTCGNDRNALLRMLAENSYSLVIINTNGTQMEGAETKQHHGENVIHKVKEYVDKMLHTNITLKEISRKFHFNCSYLGQKFKHHENMSFNEYLFMQRMERAKILLEQTDLKVYEIAKRVGYTELDWFYKRFKTYTGVSANEYRKMAAS